MTLDLKLETSEEHKHPRTYHVPVMLPEAIEALQVRAEGVYIDATLGGGGYAEAICQSLTVLGGGKLFAFDTDPNAIEFASKRLARFGEMLTIVPENFGDLRESLAERGTEHISGIVYDLGVSSNQLDTTSIGLSYRVEAPLDMRLDPRLPRTAYDVVNTEEANALKRILRLYGEEPQAGPIVRRIDEARSRAPIATTSELAAIVGRGIREDKRSAVLSRVFQALRIEVNGELENLGRSLRSAIEMTSKGGRIVVISYHSLEDRIVKDIFQTESAPKSEPGSVIGLRESIDSSRATLRLITRKPMIPTDEEVERNVRARSAKMRIAERV